MMGDVRAHPEAPYSDELLVDLVHDRENLFDKGRVDYKDEQAKAEAWEAIANTFGMRADECQTRWVRLRERFGRELRLHKRGVPPGKEWPLFMRMRWLERFIQPRNRVGGAKAHVAAAALHAALARDRGLGLGLGGLAAGPASDSGDGGVVLGGEDAAPPLWPHTFKLWGAGDHHDMEDDDSHQDMAVDLATHAASHPSTPQQAGTSSPTSADYHHGHADAPPSPRGAHDVHEVHEAGFQESVRQSLTTMAGSLESIERHLSHGAHVHDVLDPDELFARSLAATLRRLPRPRRSQAKMKLIAVLAEFEDSP